MLKKVIMDNNNSATFVCPQCIKARTMDVRRYRSIDTAIKVNCRCPCGHSYTVLLERRKHRRRKLTLAGTFLGSGNEKGFITITDLSRSGLKFKLNKKKSLMIGDKIIVSFNQEEGQQASIVEREVIVRNSKGLEVGAEFCATDREEIREACLIAADYNIQGRLYSNFIQDISAGGVFIETRNSYPTGEKITITFSIDDQNTFKITGEIARSTSAGIAVRFKNVTNFQEQQLKTLVKKMVGQKKVTG